MAIPDIELPEEATDKPPSPSALRANHPPQWLVAVIANIKGETKLPYGPSDAAAEYDRPETIQAIRQAIETDGHHTVFLNADPQLPFNLRDINPDICFNIAEGSGDDAREAQVPALLAMLHIPLYRLTRPG